MASSVPLAPPPTMAMYCLPPAVNEMGEPEKLVPTLIDHFTSSVFASYAAKVPSKEPAHTRSGVANTPL